MMVMAPAGYRVGDSWRPRLPIMAAGNLVQGASECDLSEPRAACKCAHVDVGGAHLVLAVVALASGTWVLLRRKGGRPHRRAGRVFAGSMVGLNVTALFIYDLTGGPGPFHVLAVISFVGVVVGVTHARLRQPRDSWRPLHAHWMAWSYIGLLAAAVSEATTRIPESPFFWMVAGSSGIVVIAGALVMRARMPKALGMQP